MEIKKPRLSKDKLLQIKIRENESSLEAENAILKDESFDDSKSEELNFYGVDAESLVFSRAKIGDASIVDSILSKCDFSGTIINRTTLERVEIKGSRVQGTQFMDARLTDVVIKNSKCTHASFRFSKMKNVAFVDCDLSESDFQGAEMQNVLFQNCNLQKAQLSRTKLVQVNLTSSNIENLKIDKESFGRVTVSAAQAIYLSSIFGMVIEG